MRTLLMALLAAACCCPRPVSAEEFSEKEKIRAALVARCDKEHLRAKTQFVVESSPRLLDLPATPVAGDFVVAATPPSIRFQILPDLVPEFFTGRDQYMACWANWARVIRGPDNRFFFAASDHLGKGCHINLYEYRPGDAGVRKVLDVGKVLGWTDDTYTDGKIHGRMAVMPDGTLWATTHYGVKPTEEWYKAGYRGSWLLSYHIDTGEAKNWGVPLIGNALPCFSIDTQRGIYVGTGYNHTVLCWDIHKKQTRFAGYPPNGWIWFEGHLLCDQATGKFWGMDVSQEPWRMMSFDPELNRWQRYDDLPIPENPNLKKRWHLQGHTDRVAMDGWYYWVTRNGAFFRFKPETPTGPQIQTLGVEWDEGRGGTLQLALDPTGRYIYYLPGTGYPNRKLSPVVQYDVQTGRKKVLCYIQDYIFEKYGYWCGNSYGLEVSSDGSFLVILYNGAFTDTRFKPEFGHPSLMVIDIPAAER